MCHAIVNQFLIDILQTMANILRNLSWQANKSGKEKLQKVVKILTRKLKQIKSEAVLKSFLGALWNLSNHSCQNQEDICSTEVNKQNACFANWIWDLFQ